jgi:hypothetical protein
LGECQSLEDQPPSAEIVVDAAFLGFAAASGARPCVEALWRFGFGLREIGVVYDMSRAYEGNCPRCGLKGVISGMMSNSGSRIREAMRRKMSGEIRLEEGTVGGRERQELVASAAIQIAWLMLCEYH